MRIHRFPALISFFIVFVSPLLAAEPDEGPFKRLKYRSIGPAAGGRVSVAAGVPGDPLTYYLGGAMGGVWKSSDGGHEWKPIMDDQPVSSIGYLAIAPSDPNVVYVGSGEANIRGNVAAGNGIYKTEDAGKTWKHVWKQEGQIGKVIIHPKNADIAYAAVLGNAFAANDERGVYRTTDGGKNWQRILFKDRDSGASDVCFDPTSPRTLFAGIWQARRTPWSLTSGGPGSGLYLSRDGGDSWKQLLPPPKPESPDFGKPAPDGKKYCVGLPDGIWGKVTVAVSAADGRRVYAMIEAEKGGLFRSDDGGDTWKHINDARALRQRAWYFSYFTLHPTNPDIIYVPQVPLIRSVDGGKTFQRVKGPHHGDHHDIWLDPTNPRRIIDSNDGSVDISLNGGESWFAPPLPLSQFYHVEADNHVPYNVMGSMQDIGTGRGPSNSLEEHGIPLGAWVPVGGGEAGHVVPDPSDPDVIYASEYGGHITRYDQRTRQAKCVSVYPFNPSGYAAADLKYRFQWTSPILVSPHDSKTVYHGGNVLFRSTDGGQSWKPISPDLTRNDRSKQQWSGGPITGDNTGAETYCTIFAIAEAPKQKGLLWVGSDDGLVHVSRDGGESWVNVTKNIKGLPEWGTVRCIEPSPFDVETAFLIVDAHRLDDKKPYLWMTTDLGKTWTDVTGNLARDIYLHVVRSDPKKPGMLYAGTERGVFYSTDTGKSWNPLKLNLPPVAISDLKVKGDDLVLGTNGRSIWILDDLTPIRQLGELVGQAVPDMNRQAQPDLQLALSAAATRYRFAARMEEKAIKPFENPPAGAIVHYWLKQKPKSDLVLEILDERGKKVRTLTSKEVKPDEADEDLGSYSDKRPKPVVLSMEPGLHRVVWDLRHEGAKKIPNARVDAGQPITGPFAIPGKYTLKLSADGKTSTQVVEIKPDPRLKISAEELAAQSDLTLKLRDDISRLVDIVVRLKSLRTQIEERNKLLGDEAKAKNLVQSGNALVDKLNALEEKLHNPKAKTVYDILAQKGGAKLYSQLNWLYELLKDADGVPQGIRDQYAEQSQALATLETEWNRLVAGDLARLNGLAREASFPELIAPSAMLAPTAPSKP